MQGERHAQTHAASRRVEARGAFRPEKQGRVPVAPHFNMPSKKTGNDAAGLHPRQLAVRSGLRVHQHVAQIPAVIRRNGLFKGPQGRSQRGSGSWRMRKDGCAYR